MKTPPWKSAPPADTGASAMNAPDSRNLQQWLSEQLLGAKSVQANVSKCVVDVRTEVSQ